jgi:ssDNA-binding Zn-finger/Zn-ribbon topoisomerase 1
MGYTFTEETTLVAMTCPSCGVKYAMPQVMRDNKESVGGSWFCVNGHSLTYTETEIKRLRRELEQKRLEVVRQQENYFAEQRRHERTTKQLRSLKKRTAAGVCPCCKRSFSQLARHMHTKHAEFVKKNGLPKVEEKRA